MRELSIVVLGLILLGGCAHKKIASSQPFRISSPRVLEVHVIDEAGTIVIDAQLQLTGPSGVTATAKSDKLGIIRFDNVSAGTFVLKPLSPKWWCAADYADKGHYWKEVIVLHPCDRGAVID